MMERTEDRRLPSRREFLALGAGAFVVAALPGTLRRRRLVRRTVPVMGTVADIAVVHRDPRYAQRAIDAAIADLYDVDRTMSRFRADSDIGRANREAAAGPVPVSSETADVVRQALRWADVSDGAFDPALAGATALWVVGSRARPPATHEIRRWAGRGLYRSVGVDRFRDGDVVVFDTDDAGLDLGGIAKGHAVDRAVETLRAWGITDGLVNAGGDLYALGRSEDGDAWEVGVRDPHDPSALITTLRTGDRAIATSGDYIRYFDHEGRRYHHLLDPASGEPRRTRAHSITIAAHRCIDADAAGTAVFGKPMREARHILARADAGTEVVHTA